MTVDLKGKWAVVTGADGGIGLEFCKELASMGMSLLMISNREKEVVDAASMIRYEFGVDAKPMTLDLTEEDAADRIFDFMYAGDIKPVFLINNAGIFSFAPVLETSHRKLDCFIDLHISAVVNLSRRFGEYFASNGFGRILNMSSMSCWMPMPGIAMYSATKAFIRVFSRALHYELKDSGVTVTVACPGGIATDLFGLSDNLKKLAVGIRVLDTPQKFAHKAVVKMLRGKKQYINGCLNRFSIFFVSILPTSVRMLIKRKMLDKGIRR